MQYIQHEARLTARQPDGSTLRDVLEASARRGNPVSIAALEPPEFPDGMEYLLGWSRELFARSGVGFAGVAPLTYDTLDAWARRTDRNPTPAEVDALLYLDSGWQYREDTPRPEEQPKPVTAWPTEKRGRFRA